MALLHNKFSGEISSGFIALESSDKVRVLRKVRPPTHIFHIIHDYPLSIL